ncbi:hypothetical protein BWK47_13130 [Synechocystis sp. CACIAM 05]|nr:hypothetical protein BWK47_13130 [Synechocystis sp. CACIAM 05]
MYFKKIMVSLKKNISKKRKLEEGKLEIFPLDSTIISATTKMMWKLGFHQVKLFSGIRLLIGESGGIIIHFGQDNDNKYGDKTIQETLKNSVVVMDRGLCDLGRVKKLQKEDNRYHLSRFYSKNRID